MNSNREKGEIIIPVKRKPWPHELRVANILAMAGHRVEFLPEHSTKTADIKLNGTEYEIKAPEKFNPNTLDHTIRDAIRQSPNLIIDTSRIKKAHDRQVQRFLVNQTHKAKRLKRMLMITKRGQIIDIFGLI